MQYSETLALSVMERYSEVREQEDIKVTELSESGELEDWADQFAKLPKTSAVLTDLLAGYKVRELSNRAPLFFQRLLRKAYIDVRTGANVSTGSQEIITKLTEFAGLNVVEPLVKAETDHGDGDDIGTCAYLETGFFNCLEQVNGRSVHEEERQTSIDVFYLDDGTPALFRKQLNEPSAIALVPIEIDGIPIAPGTAVKVGESTSQEDNIMGIERVGDDEVLRAYMLDSLPQLAALRITPWAYNEMYQKAVFAIEHDAFGPLIEPGRLEVVTKYSLHDMRVAASQILKACGIGQPSSKAMA